MTDLLLLFPLASHEIQAGAPLPFDVYDRGGRLVWGIGTTIDTQLHIDHGLNQGRFRMAVGAEAESPRVHKIPLRSNILSGPVEYQSARDWFFAVRSQLRKALEMVAEGKPKGLELIRAVGHRIIEATARNRDATLATIQLEQSGNYQITHALHNAIVAVTISTLKHRFPPDIHSLVCAALTHDLAMPDQERLHRERSPLSGDQWVEIKGHPLEGARRLKELGVQDPVWLETVAQHHERADGSGYPNGLKRGEIRATARVLSIADSWCAMFMGKAYRKPAEVDQVLKELKAGADPDAAALLERAVGLYPPGSVVRLSNGESAIVTAAGESPERPRLMAVLRRDNTPYTRPAEVDLKGGLEIVELTRFDPWRLSATPVEKLWRLPVVDTKL